MPDISKPSPSDLQAGVPTLDLLEPEPGRDDGHRPGPLRWLKARPGRFWWGVAAALLAANLLIGNGSLAYTALVAGPRQADRDAARIDALEDQVSALQEQNVELLDQSQDASEETRCRAAFGNAVSDQQAQAQIQILVGLLAVTDGQEVSDAQRAAAQMTVVLLQQSLDERDGSIEACELDPTVRPTAGG